MHVPQQGSRTLPIFHSGGAPINLFGTHEQKQEYLTPICTGESFGAFGLTEPNAGSDAGGTQTTAEDKGDKWVINGNKCYITNASYANHLALTAITGRNNGNKEISAIIVPTDAKGFKVIDNYEKMGLHSSNTTELVLEDVEVPEGKSVRVSREKASSSSLSLLTAAGSELGQWLSVWLRQLLIRLFNIRKKESNSVKRCPNFKLLNLSWLTWQ